MYKNSVHPLFSRFDPETIHNITLKLLYFLNIYPVVFLLNKIYSVNDTRLRLSISGLTFKNPVGLAAGFDKNASCPKILSSFGFGHVEVGTATPLAQKGKPRPRIFKLAQDSALINRLGFPNKGTNTIKSNLLKEKKRNYILGINIGPNTKAVEEKHADKDYLVCMNALKNMGDYFTINISSPNTQGLRDLAAKKSLDSLLSAIFKEKDRIKLKIPVFIKISPDLTDKQLGDMLKIIVKYPLDGVIATNTSVSRPKNLISKNKNEIGGLSGKPLKNMSNGKIKYIFKKTKGRLPIIGVGGIFNAQDAIEKIKAGASLVQIYTGFIYEGPGIAKNINLGILEYLEKHKLKSYKELIGKSVKV